MVDCRCEYTPAPKLTLVRTGTSMHAEGMMKGRINDQNTFLYSTVGLEFVTLLIDLPACKHHIQALRMGVLYSSISCSPALIDLSRPTWDVKPRGTIRYRTYFFNASTACLTMSKPLHNTSTRYSSSSLALLSFHCMDWPWYQVGIGQYQEFSRHTRYSCLARETCLYQPRRPRSQQLVTIRVARSRLA